MSNLSVPTVSMAHSLGAQERQFNEVGRLHHYTVPVQQDPCPADGETRHDHAALPHHEVQRKLAHGKVHQFIVGLSASIVGL